MKINVRIKLVSLGAYCCLILLNCGCWAPRCPEKSCHVAQEHRHQGQVFRGGSLFASRVHNPYWYFTRNAKQAQGGGVRKNTDPKTKKKFKKLLPWERV